jgi:hypothetical protein
LKTSIAYFNFIWNQLPAAPRPDFGKASEATTITSALLIMNEAFKSLSYQDQHQVSGLRVATWFEKLKGYGDVIVIPTKLGSVAICQILAEDGFTVTSIECRVIENSFSQVFFRMLDLHKPLTVMQIDMLIGNVISSDTEERPNIGQAIEDLYVNLEAFRPPQAWG